MRFNGGGELQVPFGYVAAQQLDPIEKKPFFHFFPGAHTFSFGMLGCDLHCAYCQNWEISQVGRGVAESSITEITPQQLVGLALHWGARVVVSTYNEPLITSEWAVAVFERAKAAGLSTAYVSNGNATKEVLRYLRPWCDAFKVDLKCFDDRRYRSLGGLLSTVQQTLVDLKEMGFWVEVVTLLVPGFNDSERELRALTKFLASLSPETPWHVTAFHPDYQMSHRPPTGVDSLKQAGEMGREAGLQFVYLGNVTGVGWAENTYCPSCASLLIERRGFAVLKNLLDGNHCPFCQAEIPGIF